MEKNSEYPELDEIAKEITVEVAKIINARVKNVESKMPYKAQYVLEELIKNLEELV